MNRKLALLGLSLLLTVAVLEIALRAAGFRPWGPLPYPAMPLMHGPEPELGWDAIPGEYVFGDDEVIRMTLWPGGLRATAPQRTRRERSIVLVGDSFMQGWAVSDEDTCGYQLQKAFPAAEVINLGTGGYGTHQSLLKLERFLRDTKTSPSVVIYGFNLFHEARNVAASFWLQLLSSMSQLGAVYVPYGAVAPDGSLERHAPIGSTPWPLARRLALVSLLQERYENIAGAKRFAQSKQVTPLILLEMNRVARAAGADFLVVFFSSLQGSLERYEQLFEGAGITYADCFPKGAAERAMTKYGHPGRLANAYWARCIEDALRTKLPARVAELERGAASAAGAPTSAAAASMRSTAKVSAP